MPSLILLMIAGAAVVAWWNASRAAAERAEVLGREMRDGLRVLRLLSRRSGPVTWRVEYVVAMLAGHAAVVQSGPQV